MSQKSLVSDLHNLKKTRSGKQSSFTYQQPSYIKQKICKTLQKRKQAPNSPKKQNQLKQQRKNAHQNNHKQSQSLIQYKYYNQGVKYRSDHKASQKYKIQNFRSMLAQSYGIFKKMIFCFPVMDAQLTPKRIEIISDLIHKQGGMAIPWRQNSQLHIIDYVLISRKASLQTVEDKIKNKIKCKAILDFNFVQQCLNQQKVVNINEYLLKKCDDQNQSRQQNQNQITLKRDHTQSQTAQNEQSFGGLCSKKFKPDLQQDQQNSHFYPYAQTSGKSVYDPNQRIDSDQQFFDKKSCVIPRKSNFGEYLCTRQTLNSDFKMNKLIVEELTKMLKIYEAQKDQGRICAYLKATSVIRHLPKQIKNQRDVQNLTGIGERMKQKIKQIIKTGKLHKLQQMNKSQVRVSCGQLIEVWGIGPNKANQLFKKGIKTINDLRERVKKNPQLLNSKQLIGLKYHEQFKQRIPREKVTKMFQYFKTVLFGITKTTQVHLMQVCGSYRRNKPTCGDLDIIITRKDGVSDKGLVYMLVKQLYEKKFLTDHLTIPKHKKQYSSTNYMGVCQFEGPCHHRIDIRFYPLQEYSFALMYFTGSMMFNRSIRLHATSLGLQLSDLGVVPKENKQGVLWNRPIPICYTQKDIFDLLGLPYRSPEQRDL